MNTTSPHWISKERLETFARKQRRQSICTLPQCMANRWRFHRSIRSSISGVTNLGRFLRGGVPSPSVIARQRPLVTSANNDYDGEVCCSGQHTILSEYPNLLLHQLVHLMLYRCGWIGEHKSVAKHSKLRPTRLPILPTIGIQNEAI